MAEERTPDNVRVLINVPGPSLIDPTHPTLLVLYATPNGSNVEETMGSALGPKTDWHYDLQQIAAQIRKLREIDKRENIILACVQPESKSWPAWRHNHPNDSTLIRELVDQILRRVPGNSVNVALVANSGGGSFVFGFIDGGTTIPDFVTRIVLLDANYSYDESAGHAGKLSLWLNGDKSRRLVVLAYDDRQVMLNGKLVLTETGGTYRASHRMIDTLGKDKPFSQVVVKNSVFDRYEGFDGQALVMIHRNSENKNLHTSLVADMNGLLAGMTQGTPEVAKYGAFVGPRAFSAYIQPAEYASDMPLPTKDVDISPRKPSSAGGEAILSPLAGKPYSEVEPAVLRELLDGNIPEYLRKFKTIRVMAIDASGARHTAEYYVMPDYLSIGSDTDSVRIPLTPAAAEQVARQFACVLPTRKMVDDIYLHAEVKLEPIALTQDRESVQSFTFHNGLIEAQRADKPIGLLVAGDKKDVVITNRLLERPNRVAIYGWQKLDGHPIQPLTIVHRESYVDYSHGIRLVRSAMIADGEQTTVGAVLKDPMLNILLSDEGPLLKTTYPDSALPQ